MFEQEIIEAIDNFCQLFDANEKKKGNGCVIPNKEITLNFEDNSKLYGIVPDVEKAEVEDQEVFYAKKRLLGLIVGRQIIDKLWVR